MGAFAPLSGFMTEDELRGVVGSMRLPSGDPFPMPIVLDVTPDVAAAARPGTRVSLTLDGLEVGDVLVESVYACDKAAVAVEVFGTADEAHPGVAHFFRMGSHFIGGPVRLHRRVRFEFSDYELTPDEARARFAERGWRTVVGFQTRNVPIARTSTCSGSRSNRRTGCSSSRWSGARSGATTTHWPSSPATAR